MTVDTPLPSVSLLPGTLPNEELFWHWRTGITPYFHSVPLADPRDPPLVPEVHLYNAGGFLFFDTKLSRQKFVRDASWLRRHDDSDHVALQIFQRGANQVENGGRDYFMQPGATFVVNLGYEIDSSCGDAEVLTIVLPRDAVQEHLPALDDARGLLFDHDSTAGRLFADFMQSLRKRMVTARLSDAPLLTYSTIGLLSSLLANGDPLSTDARHGTLAALQRHIEANLGDPDLGVDHLCARFRLSRATLYRLFPTEGGVRAYILRRRLLACFKALSAPAMMHRGIFAIAIDFGFNSPSHFATRFRAQFGMTPSEVREAARDHHARGQAAICSGPEGGYTDAELMQRWTEELGTRYRSSQD